MSFRCNVLPLASHALRRTEGTQRNYACRLKHIENDCTGHGSSKRLLDWQIQRHLSLEFVGGVNVAVVFVFLSQNVRMNLLI